ncbi:MAG TPA: hypothetical protein VGN25_08375 [Solirubrobacteraceae bacterium]|jgi:hypothetical protein|nr:hypothetical protein [Solirubrobacteraceae bacterium]
MATRTIVTSQPDVACDVCERRLLRGEQPDIFLAAGRRRTVCELCAPRAAHEGWMRERDSQAMTLAPLRARRGRSFFERLRQVGAGRSVAEGEESAQPAPSGSRPRTSKGYDFLEPLQDAGELPPPASTVAPVAAFAGGEAQIGSPSVPEDPATYFLYRSLEVFNASEYPRRVAGVARSLGAPQVNVRSAEHLESVVIVVVAWELCWYRYEVDLSEEPVEVHVTAQGTELGELEREERVGNAEASSSGTLALLHI